MRRRLTQAFFLLVLITGVLLCPSADAQLANGTIRGTIVDRTGAVVAQAQVSLVNESTTESFSTQSTRNGYYTFTALAPGNYKLTVTSSGFASWEGTLTLRVGQEAVVDATLQPGNVTSTVQVTDVTPEINAGDATLSDVKEATRIDTLPLENSNFLNILNFSPGVVSNSYGGQGSGYTRVNGIPGGSITFQVDGQSANDRFTNDLQATPQALQTIQELKVTTSNGSAEYATPGVIDVVTKGGTNQFHGQVHELYQTGGLEAKGFNAYSSHLVHHEFGGQVGGPVRIPRLYNGKDRTFFYFDVEKQIQHALAQDLELVPQTNWLQGDFSDYVDVNGNPVTIYDPLTGRYDPATGAVTRTPFAHNQIPSGRMNAIATRILSYLPAPNTAGCNAGRCPVEDWNFNPNWRNPLSTASDNILRYTGKFDQLLGKNLLSARYTYTSENALEPDLGGSQGVLLNNQTTQAGGHNGVLSYTRPIGLHAVNEARIGVQLFNHFVGPVPQPGLTASLGLPVYPGNTAWPGIYWDDNNQFALAGIDRQNPKSAPNQSVTAGDNYSLTTGKHEMKFGFQVANSRLTTVENQNPGGNYGFSGYFTSLQDPSQPVDSGSVFAKTNTGAGLADMLLGDTDYLFLELVPVFHTRQTDYSAYAQDNWKINSRLTLNLGLRYEYWSPFEDAGGLSATLDFKTNTNGDCTIPSTLTGAAPAACVTPGSAGYPAWFSQSQPTVVIPNHGSAQSASQLAAYEAAGLPVETASQAGISNSLWNMPKNNWAPRVGFAYQINERTVVRGGFGTYYWTMPLVQFHQNTRDNAPWQLSMFLPTDPVNNVGAELAFPYGPSTLQNQCNCATLPDQYVNPRALGTPFVTASNETASINSGFGIAAWDPNYKTQKANEWNLTVERVLPGDWALRMGYIGNHGGNLVDYDPVNAGLPREYMTAHDFGNAALRPYPIYGDAGTSSMDEFRFVGYSNHNEGRIELNHTFKGSFILQSYFTFAKTLTTSEGTYNSFGGLQILPRTQTNNAPLSQRLRAIYAPDSSIAGKTFVINGHYELPFGRGKALMANAPGILNEVISGWNASMFYMWHSGRYFSPYYNANPGVGSGASAANAYVLAPGSPRHGILPREERSREKWFDASVWDPASGTAYNGQTFIKRDNPLDYDIYNGIPRNYMTGPGFSNADGTLYKLTPLGEHLKFDLEMQVFNVFNHTNLGLPSNNGVISTGVGTPRLLQFQGKLIF